MDISFNLLSTNQSHMLKKSLISCFSISILLLCWKSRPVLSAQSNESLTTAWGKSSTSTSYLHLHFFFLGLCFSILASLYCISAFYYVFLFFFLFLFVSSFIYLYIPRRTDTFIGMRMIPTLHHREFPCVQGNTLTITVGF